MKTQIKFHKQFGEVEIINTDTTTTTIIVLKTGETKKLINAYAKLMDEPQVKAKKVKTIQRELTSEEKLNIEYLRHINGFSLEDKSSMVYQSKIRRKEAFMGYNDFKK